MILTIALILVAIPSWAVLGETEQSVYTDQELMVGQLQSTTYANYTQHEITTPDGRKVREYAAGGAVFGIAWSGKSMPDLSQLLGSYFPAFQQAVASSLSSRIRLRGPLFVQVGSLVVVSDGQMRFHFGHAYLSNLIPANFSTDVMTFIPAASTLQTGSQSVSTDSTASQTTSTSDTSSTLNSGAPNNVLAVQVNAGPPGVNAVDTPYVSVKICVPGSSTMCQTIPDVLVDTGSEGLRLLSSVITIPLKTVMNNNASIGECEQFASLSYTWGPVQTADISLAGENASAQSIQVINAPGFASVPTGSTGCQIPGGQQITDAISLGSNGILGVGPFRQDCGSACVSSAIPATYYSCVGQNCTPTEMPLLSQLQNPVWRFPHDNNGVLVELPSIGLQGAATANGSLIFGIGTQNNNALNGAKIYTTDDNGLITTTYFGTPYPSSIDSGSNGIFFLNNLPNCTINQGWYCPNFFNIFLVENTGANGVSGYALFGIANFDRLLNLNPNFTAFNDIGAPFPGFFDFGLPFFFGNDVFTGIEGQATGQVKGPFFAY